MTTMTPESPLTFFAQEGVALADAWRAGFAKLGDKERGYADSLIKQIQRQMADRGVQNLSELREMLERDQSGMDWMESRLRLLSRLLETGTTKGDWSTLTLQKSLDVGHAVHEVCVLPNGNPVVVYTEGSHNVVAQLDGLRDVAAIEGHMRINSWTSIVGATRDNLVLLRRGAGGKDQVYYLWDPRMREDTIIVSSLLKPMNTYFDAIADTLRVQTEDSRLHTYGLSDPPEYSVVNLTECNAGLFRGVLPQTGIGVFESYAGLVMVDIARQARVGEFRVSSFLTSIVADGTICYVTKNGPDHAVMLLSPQTGAQEVILPLGEDDHVRSMTAHANEPIVLVDLFEKSQDRQSLVIVDVMAGNILWRSPNESAGPHIDPAFLPDRAGFWISDTEAVRLYASL